MNKGLYILFLAIMAPICLFARTESDYPAMIYDFYVDATIDNTWPTDAASYTELSDWAYDATTSADVIYNKWYIKGGTTSTLSGAALYGTAFQGCGTSLPQLTMTTGDILDPAKSYNVYVVCWCRNDTEYWHTFAGLEGGILWLCDSISEYDNFFNVGEFVITGTQLFLGQVSGVSSVSVNVDGPNFDDAGKRAWFDGLAFVETTPGPFVTLDISASITDPSSVAENPIDASVINTSPSLGSNPIVQGTRLRVEADTLASNCPDIYDFTGLSGDVSQSGNTVNVKMDSNMTIVVNYEVRDYTPSCGGDICHPLRDGDTDGNCLIDLIDVTNIAGNWLVCTRPECD